MGWALTLILVALTGCQSATKPAETGASRVVQSFYHAILQKDWASAYAILDSDSKRRCNEQQFGQLATAYCQALGFEPTELHVRSCEEHGSEAIAHVVLTGHAKERRRTYKDGVALRLSRDNWAVVLPANFGRVQPRTR